MVQRVIVAFCVESFLPLAEAVQAVVSVMRNLQVVLFATGRRWAHRDQTRALSQITTNVTNMGRREVVY